MSIVRSVVGKLFLGAVYLPATAGCQRRKDLVNEFLTVSGPKLIHAAAKVHFTLDAMSGFIAVGIIGWLVFIASALHEFFAKKESGLSRVSSRTASRKQTRRAITGFAARKNNRRPGLKSLAKVEVK